MRISFRLIVILATCGLLSAAALRSMAPTPLAAANTIGVDIRGLAFVPNNLTVTGGTTVVWTNRDGVTHTVTSDSQRFESGPLGAGQSFMLQGVAEGTFLYHCSIHSSMTGKLVVVAPQPQPTPTATPIGTAPAPTLTAPIDGGTLSSFAPTLSWSNPPDTAQVQLQLIPANNDGPGADLVLSGSPTSFSVPPPPQWYGLLPDMGYTWRIRTTASADASITDPTWGPYAERHLRTPVVSSEGIVATSPLDGEAIFSNTPTLIWVNNRNDVFYYELQLSKDPSFGADPARSAMIYSALLHGGVTQPRNSYTVPAGFPLERGTAYFWQVRPRIQGDGTPLPWQNFQFTVAP